MNKIRMTAFFVLSKIAYPVFAIMPGFIVRFFLRFANIGESSLSFGLRYLLYKRLFKLIGKKVIFSPFSTIKSPSEIMIGSNVSINHNCFFEGVGGIDIGSNVMIAHQVTIMSNSHITKRTDVPMKNQGVELKKVIIEDDVWIGAKSTILCGVKIGKGSIVAANSVVNKDVEEFTVVGGVPAKPIKKR